MQQKVNIVHFLRESLIPPSHTPKFNLYLHKHAPLRTVIVYQSTLVLLFPLGKAVGLSFPHPILTGQSLASLSQCNSGVQGGPSTLSALSLKGCLAARTEVE